MKKYILRLPKYFNEFHCIAEKCSISCCRNWGFIIWKDEEYEKLMSAKMSDELRGKLSAAFVRKTHPATGIENWNICEIPQENCENGRICPLVTEEKLCAVQKELGEEYLSNTCKIFPRISGYANGLKEDVCSGACPEVISMLMRDKDAMKRTDYLKTTKEKYLPGTKFDTEETLRTSPIKKYRREIFELLYGLIEDEGYSPETGIILGTMAVRRLHGLAEEGKADKIPDEIKLMRDELGTPQQLAQIDGIKPNYKVKLAVMGEIFLKLSEKREIKNILNLLYDETGALNITKYEISRACLGKVMAGKEYFFRNLALNSLLELYIMFFRKETTLYDFWLYYCVFYSIMTLVAAIGANFGENAEIYIRDYLAVFFKIVSHDSDTINSVIALLKERGCTNTAHIALMLK